MDVQPNVFVCDLCYPSAVEIGEVADGYWLAKDDQGYFLIEGHGHNDDIFFRFKTTPWPDPDPDSRYDLSDVEEEKANKWLNDHDADFNDGLPMAAHSGWCFVEACLKSGFDPRSKNHLFELWLYNRCGELIQEYNRRVGVPLPTGGASN